MKRFLLLWMTFILTTALWAYDFQSGELYYNITSSTEPYTVEVTYQTDMLVYNYQGLISVTIPTNVTNDGITYTVTSIGEHAFSNCEGLTSVTIPNSVTSIGGSAFNNCAGLTSITIPESVTSIGNYAFEYCRGLTSIIIPNSVTSIGGGAFCNCRGLTSITIPNSVTSIDKNAFRDCTGLISIAVEDGNTVYDSRENCNAIIETATNTLIQGCQATVIPNGVTSIGEYAFCNCTSLTSITIPESVTSIGKGAFLYCQSLTSVVIPNSVTSIGESAFGNVANIVYNGTATGSPWGAKSVNGYVDGYLVYADATKTTLLACSGAAKGTIAIPNSVKSIGNWAFLYCWDITSITIPNSVTSIGDGVFYGCGGLTYITIPNSVTSIGVEAFSGCYSLTSLVLPNSVTSIGEGAFNGCTGLKSLVIPNSVTDIPANLLGGLKALDSISVPAAVFYELGYNESETLSYAELNRDEMTDDVLSVLQRNYKTLRTLDVSQTTNTTLPDEALRNCYNLQTLRLPANLTTIPYMAVADCKSLQSITIPASVTEIENSAFENCRSLKSVVFEGATTDGTSTCSLRRIGNWAFYNCHELQSLTVPEGVTEIGNAAFYGCTYLTEITLPSSVTSIDDNAFALCSKIQKIRVAATTPPTLRAKTFYEVNRSIPVYVPAEAVSDYKSDTYWREFNIQAYAPTAIDNTTADTIPHKVFRDGQVLILRNGKTYTVTGVEVK